MTDRTIQVRKRHNDDAAMDIDAVDRQTGELAAFISGAEVDRHALLDDIAATVRA